MAAKKKNNPFLMWLIGWAVPAWIRLVHATTRWEVLGEKNYQAALQMKDGFIVAFWHSRIAMMIPVRQKHDGRFFFMSSDNREGDMMIHAVRPFRIEFARGSARNVKKKDKNKGGSAAFLVLLKALREGAAVGLTPDGPRGPRQVCQPGIVALANKSGKPVLPVACAVRRSHIFNSWDRFHLPLPFSRGCYVYGEPVKVAAETPEELEQVRLQIEQALNRVTAEADRRAGIRNNDG